MEEKTTKPTNKRFKYGLRRLSDRLFYARIKAKLSIDDVAKIRNISANTVKRWEKREGTPKNKNLLLELAEIYNVSFPWLSIHFGNEEDTYEQGFELINELWKKLDLEKQKATMVNIIKMMEKERVNSD